MAGAVRFEKKINDIIVNHQVNPNKMITVKDKQEGVIYFENPAYADGLGENKLSVLKKRLSKLQKYKKVYAKAIIDAQMKKELYQDQAIKLENENPDLKARTIKAISDKNRLRMPQGEIAMAIRIE